MAYNGLKAGSAVGRVWHLSALPVADLLYTVVPRGVSLALAGMVPSRESEAHLGTAGCDLPNQKE